jgi:hypothetical protein
MPHAGGREEPVEQESRNRRSGKFTLYLIKEEAHKPHAKISFETTVEIAARP